MDCLSECVAYQNASFCLNVFEISVFWSTWGHRNTVCYNCYWQNIVLRREEYLQVNLRLHLNIFPLHLTSHQHLLHGFDGCSLVKVWTHIHVFVLTLIMLIEEQRNIIKGSVMEWRWRFETVFASEGSNIKHHWCGFTSSGCFILRDVELFV